MLTNWAFLLGTGGVTDWKEEKRLLSVEGYVAKLLGTGPFRLLLPKNSLRAQQAMARRRAVRLHTPPINLAGKTVFLHIPKAGGMSVKSLIASELSYRYFRYIDDFRIGLQPAPEPLVSLGHLRLSDLIATNLVDWPESNPPRFFTVVRNPWDRLVSLWRYLQAEKRNIPRNWSFETFLVHCLGSLPTPGLINSAALSQAAPAHLWLEARSQQRVESLTIFKIEDLTRDNRPLTKYLGLPNKKLPRINSSVLRPNVGRVAKAVQQRVLDFYEHEFALGYPRILL